MNTRVHMNNFIKSLSENLGIQIEESSTSIGFGSTYSRDHNGNIVKLELYQSGLKKLQELEPISKHLKILNLNELLLDNIESIGMFTHLEELSMHLESISSLNGLEKLKNLKRLSISCEEVDSLKEIESIDSLVQLKLYCPYPPPTSIDFKNLRSLEILKLSGFESIDMIQGIDKLKHLDLKNCDIPKISGMNRCLNLQFLSFASNPLTKIEGLEQLKFLKYLDISSTQISRIENLEELRDLEVLLLGHTSVARIEGLESMINLKHLDLTNSLGESNTPIAEIGSLEHLSNLERLILTGHRITVVENLPTENLKFLDVSWNKIDSIDYNWLRNIKKPCTIDITGNPMEVDFLEIPDHITFVDEKKN